MWKIVVVLVTLFALTLSGEPEIKHVYINWGGCTCHLKITYDDPGYCDEEYRVYHENKTAFAIRYQNVENYYVYMIFDLQTSKITRLSNESGECDVATISFYDVYDSLFEYSTDEEVVCPDKTPGCHKYCNNGLIAEENMCIILDSYNHLLQADYLDYDEIHYYTLFDDAPTLDMFDLLCEGIQYSAEGYCPDQSSHTSPSSHGSGSAGSHGSDSAGSHGSGSAGSHGSGSAGSHGSGSAGSHGSGSAGSHGSGSAGSHGSGSTGSHGSGSHSSPGSRSSTGTQSGVSATSITKAASIVVIAAVLVVLI